MKKTFLALILLLGFNVGYGQLLSTSTARQYLNTSTSFSQSLIDSFNSAVNYQQDIVGGAALSYPGMQPVQLTWNGISWVSDTAVSLTTNFNTLLMVSNISHSAVTPVMGNTSASITVDWPDVSGVTQYRFRMRPVGGTWGVNTVTGSQRTVNHLSFNTSYEVMVRVFINSTTQGEYTQSYTFTTPMAPPPLPPCNTPVINSASISNGQLTLSWGSVAQATGYQVQVRELNTLSWGGTTVNTTSYAVNINPMKAYEYQVRAACTGALTAWSTFSPTDTVSNANCQPPTNMSNVGNTFYWTNYQYSALTQIQTRMVGNTIWGGSSTVGNQFTFGTLWGYHEWRLRTRCYGTVSDSWTDWTPVMQTGWIPKPMSFESFDNSTLYPNPTNGMVYGKGKLVVTDLSGRVLMTGEEMVDLTNLQTGVYFINKQKIVKQ